MLQQTDGQYFLLLGSFGALMALQFGAPNSPLAQPRNALLGNSLAAAVAVVFRYLSGPNDEHCGCLPQWAVVALAPATAIALSQRVGLLHPPAGAASLIYVAAAPGKITSLGFMYLLMPLLVGNVFCCLMATAINNVSRARQYPLFY